MFDGRRQGRRAQELKRLYIVNCVHALHLWSFARAAVVLLHAKRQFYFLMHVKRFLLYIQSERSEIIPRLGATRCFPPKRILIAIVVTQL